MTSSRFLGPMALVMTLAFAGGFPGTSIAQDQAVKAPPGQGESGATPVAPESKDSGERGQTRELQAVQAAPARDPDLDRARAAARAADPRLQGLEKAREAARKAADQNGAKDCLSAREARSAIMAKRAVTLSQALRAARDAWDGEVIDYKLCTFDGALAYDLTLLNGGGRVARVRVGAADGKLVNVR